MKFGSVVVRISHSRGQTKPYLELKLWKSVGCRVPDSTGHTEVWESAWPTRRATQNRGSLYLEFKGSPQNRGTQYSQLKGPLQSGGVRIHNPRG